MSRRFVRTVLFVAASIALALAPHLVSAQDLPRVPRRAADAEPDYWVGLSYGIMNGLTLTDGATGNVWQFGYAPQIRANVEKRLARGVTGGVSASYTTAPLTFYSSTASSGCFNSCDANADITQYLAFIRGGSGTGFHGTYMLDAGATSFSNFREKGTDAKLGPTTSSYDFTFGFGGGLGYGINGTSDVYVAEQTDLVLHSQGSGANGGTAPRLFTFVLGARIGF